MHRLRARTRCKQSLWAGGFAICLLAVSVPSWSATAASDLSGTVQGEKKLVVYHTTTLPNTGAIAQGFKKKYPFAEVENYRGTGEKLLQRITTEVRAGQNLADVYIISGLQTWLMKDMGLLNIYRLPGAQRQARLLDRCLLESGSLGIQHENGRRARCSEEMGRLTRAQVEDTDRFGGGRCLLVHDDASVDG